MHAPSDVPPTPQAIALCRLGPALLAVDIRHVEHALARPAHWVLLPRRDDPVEGVLDDHGQPVLVVDLRRWLPWPGALEPASLVLVLRTHGRRSAIVIDAVEGVHRTAPTQFRRVTQSLAPGNVFHTVVRPDLASNDADAHAADGAGSTAWVPLLDVLAFADLCHHWTPEADNASPETVAPDDGALRPCGGHIDAQAEFVTVAPPDTGPPQTLALFSVAGQDYAVPAHQVMALAPLPPWDLLFSAGAAQQGMVRWRDRHVAVLRSQHFTGRVAIGPSPQMVVLEVQGQWVGLPVDVAYAVAQVDVAAHVRPAGESGLRDDLPALGVIADGRRPPFLLLDAQRLAAHAVAGASSHVDTKVVGRPRNEDAYVVFRADTAWAVLARELSSIEQVAPQALAAEGGPQPLLYRGQPIALYDGRRALGGARAGRFESPPRLSHAPAVPDDAVTANAADAELSPAEPVMLPALVLHTPQGLRALVVDELLALLPRHSCELQRLQLPGSHAVSMLNTLPPRPAASYTLFDERAWSPIIGTT